MVGPVASLLGRRHQERADRVDVGVRGPLTDGQCVYGHQSLVVQHRVLEVMKKRARVIGRVVGMCRRKGKGEHCVGGGRVLVLVVLVLKSKGRRW